MSSQSLLYGLCLALLLPIRVVLANIETPAVVSASDPADQPKAEVSAPAATETDVPSAAEDWAPCAPRAPAGASADQSASALRLAPTTVGADRNLTHL